MDTSAVLGVLKQLTGSPQTAWDFVERVDITFHGYDHTSAELFEIPEVRDFVFQFDEQFPFWLFFLSKHHLGLQCLLFFFTPFSYPRGTVKNLSRTDQSIAHESLVPGDE